MGMRKSPTALLLLGLEAAEALAQLGATPSPFAYGDSSRATAATIASLELFGSLKLGMFMHNGPVTQWGTEISFPLVCGSFPCTVQGPGGVSLNITSTAELRAHRLAYRALATTYNPSQFDPTHVAKTAAAAGFKYVVYTTVHCDGFANWPSNVTAYNIANTPFGRDLFGELAVALRKEGLLVGAYICPTLWNNDNFWSPDALTALSARGAVRLPNGRTAREVPTLLHRRPPDAGSYRKTLAMLQEYPTYSPLDQPARWQAYLQTLHGMARELANRYAPDLFWFDCHDSPPLMDTRLEAVLGAIRGANPSALVLTRNGIFSDYTELVDQSEAQAKAILGEPSVRSATQFEIGTVLQASKQWSFDPKSGQKNVSDVLGNLMMIVAKGGNYLVNVAPGPDGRWAPGAEAVLARMAAWMEVNGEALHGATPMDPFEADGAFFTSRPAASGGIAVYVLVPATAPSAQRAVASAPTPGRPTGARSVARVDVSVSATEVFAPPSPPLASLVKIMLKGFRPALLSPNVKLLNAELLGANGTVVTTLDDTGLTLNASAIVPSPLPATSPLSDGLVFKLSFAQVADS